MNTEFPNDFLWGAAASAYQIEGAHAVDGRGWSTCDMWSRKPGAVWQGHNGDHASRHHERWREDVDLMAGIGLQAYRFSFSWTRVLPEGRGAINERGLAFYDRLVDALLAAGIRPIGTLHHWDYPYELYCRGGWLNRDSADWFADYTRVLVDRFSDRITDWLPINEPQCIAGFGHSTGSQPPGVQLARREALRVGHHLLLAHGKSVQVIRAHARRAPRVGCAPVGVVAVPATDSPADIEAARRATFAMPPAGAWQHFWNSVWWFDPLVLGRYPEEGLRLFGDDAPRPAAGDMETICQPLDFLGANLYSAAVVRAAPDGATVKLDDSVNQPRTAFHWPVTPTILRWGPRFFHERYRLPVLVTENGLSNVDWPSLDGAVHDPQRIDYVRRHLLELHRAIQEDTPVLGYLHWSLLDNFEWDHGYRERFGLVYVDYETGRRIPKDSARWYREVILSRGARLSSA